MTLGVSAAQLARMRSQVAELLPGTAIIQAPTNTVDSMGGVTQSYAAVTGGTVICRLDPLGNRASPLQLYAGRETLKKMQQLTVPHDAPLASDYRVVIATQTYEIVQLDDVHSNNVSKRAILAEVE